MKVFIETLGCPKNFNDSEVAAGILEDNNYVMVNTPDEADVIMLNTCGFINDAKKESIDKIFELLEYKTLGKKLVVSGCLSQRYADDLFTEIPEVDAFIGVNQYDKLPEILGELDHRKNIITPCDEKILEKHLRKLQDNPYSATLKIAEGCNNICAYCVIPEIRGRYRSKKEEDVLLEAEELAQAGCKELILIAQDVTYYGKDLYGEFRLAKLLKKLCKISGIQWIRLMYCYEDRITDELIEVIKSEDKICNYLDIPIQHASNDILKSMNRRSTRESIKNTINRLKTAIPDIHIRTTLIVGFPGETEDDYDQLVDFVLEEKFSRLGVFGYSKEENTVAGNMKNQIDSEVKEQRLDGIMRRQLDISLELNQREIGKTLDVLVEEKDEENSYLGRSMYDAPEIDNSVIFTSCKELKPGDMVKVLINDAFDYDLVGTEV
ncbi:MAG: 30S ribosomal protein S12 methylthiotransferase RimO [Anaerovoracaceae bacterium]